MTGFASVDGDAGALRWTWEARSVNGRGLELRFRLPSGMDSLEPQLRKKAQAAFARGSMNISLSLKSDAGDTRFAVNEEALARVAALAERVKGLIDCDPPRADGLLMIKGVIEPVDDLADEAKRAALHEALLESFDKTLVALKAARLEEGAALGTALSGLIERVENLTTNARDAAGAAPAAIRARLEGQLAELLKGGDIPEDRLAQEAALLAVKADVREELDRLSAHVEAGRALLKSREPSGRRLDFLVQELNREANTLCAKAPDMTLKRIGLDLKQTVDQLREQVQNIE